MHKYFTIILLLLFVSCNTQTPTVFSKAALSEEVYTINDSKQTFENVLKESLGKKIVIDVWASWCRDCLVSLPKTKQLQKKYPEVVFLFLSVDKNKRAWKNGIKKHHISGLHYNLPKGMDSGSLVDFLNLGWIPRYLVIDEEGKIALFKATRAIDKRIEEALKE
jgi:thiol-disulfide isomerase/thioredoxin